MNDSHFHLTNYIQEGTDIRQFLEIMGDKVGRVALFGIPLQQMWSYENSGDFAPTYCLQSDAPPDQATYLRVYRQYDPLWKLLTPDAREKVRKGNYDRLFDAVRLKVRKWEAANVNKK